MASISKEKKRDSWKLTWYVGTKRKAMRLGSMPKKTAEQFRVKFEELLGVSRGSGPMPQALTDWSEKLDGHLRTKLEQLGLLQEKRRLTLGVFLNEYRESRSAVSIATAVRDRQVCDLLIERFGADKELDTIKFRDAEEWVAWLATEGNKRDADTTKLEGNTVRRRTGTARQIFATAISWELLTKNPFVSKKLPTTVGSNELRKKFVSWENVKKVIGVAPTTEWKALIAFVRLVGPRVPSELVGLTWADIDFVAKKILIKSPKTKHHGDGHGMRDCPMFPELVPYLQELAEQVGPGVDVPLSSPVFPIAIDPGVNLRTALTRMIVQAGLEPWEKLFVNLRSSRETELLAVFPITDVCRWFGHSPQVAVKFYAQARSEVSDRATTERTLTSAGAQVGNEVDAGGDIGAPTGDINTHQDTSKNNPDEAEDQANQGVLSVPECLSGIPDEYENGRYWTRKTE